MQQWRGIIDISTNFFVTNVLSTRFNLQYKATVRGLPSSIIFNEAEFFRSGTARSSHATSLLTDAPASEAKK